MMILTNSYYNIASMTLIKVCLIVSLVRANLKSVHPVNIDDQNMPTEYKAYTIKDYEDKTNIEGFSKNTNSSTLQVCLCLFSCVCANLPPILDRHNHAPS